MNRVLLFLILLENVFQMNGRYIQITAKVPIFEHFSDTRSVTFSKRCPPEVEHVHIGFQYRCFPVQKMPSKQSCLKGISFFLKASAFIVSYIIKNSRNIRHPRINRPENYIFRTLLLLGYQVLRDLRERFHNIPGGS